MTILGFTGTRLGMTDPQRMETGNTLNIYRPHHGVHGGAPGADLDFHDICLKVGDVRCEVFPARDDLPLWVVETALEVWKVQPPLQRNTDIVNSCTLLLATPAGKEIVRSGTWATVRYARRQHKHIRLVYPDGRVVQEDGN